MKLDQSLKIGRGGTTIREALIDELFIDFTKKKTLLVRVKFLPVQGEVKAKKLIISVRVPKRGTKKHKEVDPYLRDYFNMKLRYTRHETISGTDIFDSELEFLKSLPDKAILHGVFPTPREITDKKRFGRDYSEDDSAVPLRNMRPGHVFSLIWEDTENTKEPYRKSRGGVMIKNEGWLHHLYISIPKKEDVEKSETAKLVVDTSKVKAPAMTGASEGFPPLKEGKVYKLTNGQMFVFPGLTEIKQVPEDNTISFVSGKYFMIKYWNRSGAANIFRFPGYSALSKADIFRLMNSDVPMQQLAGQTDSRKYKWKDYADPANSSFRDWVDFKHREIAQDGPTTQLGMHGSPLWFSTLYAMCHITKYMCDVYPYEKDANGKFLHSPDGKGEEPETFDKYEEKVWAATQENRNKTYRDTPKVPGLSEATKFFPHQCETFARINNMRDAILDISMGGGKTVTSLSDALIQMNKTKVVNGKKVPFVNKPLVVMPNNKLLNQQYAEMKSFTNGYMNIILLSSQSLNQFCYEIEVMVEVDPKKKKKNKKAVKASAEEPSKEIEVTAEPTGIEEELEGDVEYESKKKQVLNEEEFASYIKALPRNTIILSTYTALSKCPVGVKGNEDIERFPIPEAMVKGGVEYVFLDESHKIKNSNTNRTRAVKVLSSVPIKRIGSGTLITKNPLDLFAQFGWLNSTVLGREKDFVDANGAKDKKGRLVGWKTPDENNGFDCLAYVREQIQNNGVLMRRSRWMWMLPKREIHYHSVDMTSFQQQLYNEILDAAMEGFGSGGDITSGGGGNLSKAAKRWQSTIVAALKQAQEEGKEVDVSEIEFSDTTWLSMLAPIEVYLCNPESSFDYDVESESNQTVSPDSDDDTDISDITKARINMIVESVKTKIKEGIASGAATKEDFVSAKVAKIVEILDKHFENPENGKVLILANHKNSVKGIFNNLGKYKSKAEIFSSSFGSLDAFKDRDSNTKILIAVLDSVKEGHNFQFANRVICLGSPWSPGDLEQALARVYRIGSAKSGGKIELPVVFVDFVLCNHSFDMLKVGRMISQAAMNAKIQSGFEPSTVLGEGERLKILAANPSNVEAISTMGAITTHLTMYSKIDEFEQQQGEVWKTKYPAQRLEDPNPPGEVNILEGSALLEHEVGTENADTWSPLKNYDDETGKLIPSTRKAIPLPVVDIELHGSDEKDQYGNEIYHAVTEERGSSLISGDGKPVLISEEETVLPSANIRDNTRNIGLAPESVKLAPIEANIKFNVLLPFDEKVEEARASGMIEVEDTSLEEELKEIKKQELAKAKKKKAKQKQKETPKKKKKDERNVDKALLDVRDKVLKKKKPGVPFKHIFELFLYKEGVDQWVLCVDAKREREDIPFLKRNGFKYVSKFVSYPFFDPKDMVKVFRRLDKAGIAYTPDADELLEEAGANVRYMKRLPKGQKLRRFPKKTSKKKDEKDITQRWVNKPTASVRTAGKKKGELELFINVYDRVMMLSVDVEESTVAPKTIESLPKFGFKFHRPFYYFWPKKDTQIVNKLMDLGKSRICYVKNLQSMATFVFRNITKYKYKKLLKVAEAQDERKEQVGVVDEETLRKPKKKSGKKATKKRKTLNW